MNPGLYCWLTASLHLLYELEELRAAILEFDAEAYTIVTFSDEIDDMRLCQKQEPI